MKTKQQELIRQFEEFDFSVNNDKGDEVIFEPDQRQKVDSSTDPYDRLGKVICEFYSVKDKKYFKKNGTGCIIKGNIILTSAHALYYDQFNQLLHKIHFKPEGKNLIPVKKYYINPKYFEEKTCKSNSRTSYDYAILIVEDDAMLEKKPSLKFHKNYHQDDLNKQQSDKKDIEKYPLQVIGYSNLSSTTGVLMKERKYAIKGRNQSNLIGYRHSTESGCSGGPVFIIKPNNNFQLIGVHKGSKEIFNYCVLLSNQKQIHEFFQKQSTQQELENILECYMPVFQVIKQHSQIDTMKFCQQSMVQLTKWQNFYKSEVQKIISKKCELQAKKLNRQYLQLFKNTQIDQKFISLHQNQLFNLFLIFKTNKFSDQNQFSQVQAEKTISKIKFCYNTIDNLSNRVYTNSKQKLNKDLSLELDGNQFYLYFFYLTYRVQKFSLKSILQFNNWTHIQILSFQQCQWFGNQQWQQLIGHAQRFKNLKILFFRNNKISKIGKNDISKFSELQVFTYTNHQLLEDSIRNLEDHSKTINNFKLILQTKQKKGYFHKIFSWG